CVQRASSAVAAHGRVVPTALGRGEPVPAPPPVADPKPDLITLLPTAIGTHRQAECTGSPACPYYPSQLQAAKNPEEENTKENVRTAIVDWRSNEETPSTPTERKGSEAPGADAYLASKALTDEDRPHFESIREYSARHCGKRSFTDANPSDREFTRKVIAAIGGAGELAFWRYAERQTKGQSFDNLGILLKRLAPAYANLRKSSSDCTKDSGADCGLCADLGAVLADGRAILETSLGAVGAMLAAGTAKLCSCKFAKQWT